MAAAAPAGVAFAVECATGAELSLDAQRRGTASCTVRNLSGKRLRARLSVTPLQSAAANWFGIQGPSELVFEVGAEQPVTIDVAADAKAAAGSYAFRLDVASVANPDDEWANGPPTSFALSDPEDDHKKPFPWRWVAIGGGGLLALGASAVLAVVLLRGWPDLVVTAVRISPEAPTAGDDVQVQIDVKNVGDKAAGPSVVSWTESDGGAKVMLAVEALDPDELQTVSTPWHPPEGTYDSLAVVDADSTIDESDEQNNELGKPVTVLAAPALTAHVTVTFSEVTVNDSLDPILGVGEMRLELSVNDERASWRSESISAGGTYPIDRTLTLTLGASESLRVFANGTELDFLDPDDPMGQVVRTFDSNSGFGDGSYSETSDGCGCYTLVFTISVVLE